MVYVGGGFGAIATHLRLVLPDPLLLLGGEHPTDRCRRRS